MQDEKLKILEMVGGGKISPEEGVKLLQALEGSEPGQHVAGAKAKFLKVKVIDQLTGKTQVNVNLPVAIVKFGLKMAEKFSPEMREAGLDWEDIHRMIQEGAEGKLVEVEDEKEHKKVEVWFE